MTKTQERAIDKKVAAGYRKRDTGEVLNRPSLEPAVQAWRDALAARKAAEEAVELAAKVLKAAFGDATEIDAGAYTISYKLRVREEYVVPTSRFRVLTLEEDRNLDGKGVA